jgi:hypothetical protein
MSQLHTKTDEIKAAKASSDDACEALLNLRKSRDELLQQAVDAKAEIDEAKRTRDHIFYLDCDIDAVMEFLEKRLIGFEDSFDQAIELLIEQHAAVKEASAELKKREETYLRALTKRRCRQPIIDGLTTLGDERAADELRPRHTPPDNEKAPGGKSSYGEVRNIVSEAATNPSLGREIALKVLDREGGGAKNVSSIKPAHLDMVYEAFERLLDAERG